MSATTAPAATIPVVCADHAGQQWSSCDCSDSAKLGHTVTVTTYGKRHAMRCSCGAHGALVCCAELAEHDVTAHKAAVVARAAAAPARCDHLGCRAVALPSGDLCLEHQHLYEDWSGCLECISAGRRCRECAESIAAEARVDAVLDGDYDL